MNIAIIGSGISGLSCAYYLSRHHRVTVFEAERHPGGHTATMDVQLGTRRYAIDTGFIVFNDRTYPNFLALLRQLGVPSKPTSMGFSVCDEASGLEYAGANLDTLFAQRRNLMRPAFLAMVRDILRFNREAQRDLETGALRTGERLGNYLERVGYSGWFRDKYLVPMAAAIWSSDCDTIIDFPVEFFLRFFRNHGLLSVRDRPQWRVIEGGSREYLAPLIAGFEDRIETATPVAGMERPSAGGVVLHLQNGGRRHFDQAVLATHSDQALRILRDASTAERQVLAAIPYQSNDVVLHTDTRLLPRNRKTWSSWNYRTGGAPGRPVLTYNMNILQGISAPETFCVTLNATDAINPHKIIGRFTYDHPVYSLAATAAQRRWGEINGVRNTWFCGAWWGNGFHEDGVVSALRVADALNGRGERAA